MTRQTVNATTTVTYYATDHLGTVRATVTVSTSGTEQYRTVHDYEPFGLEIPPRDTVSPNTHRFTGHERDGETGNDYMHFRMFEASFGRFMKPDNVNGTPTNPQSWNLYSYVHGNPVNFNDPTGHEAGQAWGSKGTIPGGIPNAATQLTNDALDGGLGLGGVRDDLAFSGAFDAWCSLMDLSGWRYNPRTAEDTTVGPNEGGGTSMAVGSPNSTTTNTNAYWGSFDFQFDSRYMGKPIPPGLADQCIQISHRGLWAEVPTEDTSMVVIPPAGDKKDNASFFPVFTYKLIGITAIFRDPFNGTAQMAKMSEMLNDTLSESLIYRGIYPPYAKNPYAVFPQLGPEPTNVPLPYGSQYLGPWYGATP